jgi:hypothetical protein
MFKNRAQRIIYGHKKMCYQEGEKNCVMWTSQFTLAEHYWGDESRGIRWLIYLASVGEKTNTYKILVDKSERDKHLGSHMPR